MSSNTLVKIQKKYSDVRTMQQAINSDSWSIAKTRKDYDPATLKNLIGSMLMQLNNFSGVNNKLSQEQAAFVVEFIYDEMWMLKIADLVVFFRDVGRGNYGQLYNSLSPDRLCIWLRDYLDKRMEYSQVNSQRNHEKSLETIKTPLNNEQVKELYSKMKNDPDLWES